MSGIIVLVVLIAWFFAVRWLARRMTNRITITWKKQLGMWVLVPLLFLLPFTDGIIGGLYLHHLCNQSDSGFFLLKPLESIKRAKREDLLTKRFGASFYEIEMREVHYVDLDTNQVFAHYKNYQSTKTIWPLQIIQFGGGGSGMSCTPQKHDLDVVSYLKLNQLLKAGELK